MKSTMLQENTRTPEVFPKLKIFKRSDEPFVVLFSDETTGTVVWEQTNTLTTRVGEHSNEWASTAFEDFDGTITLEN